jgi:hypothetical protein
MPGGYGTYGPWGSAGETYSQPEPSWQQQGGPGHPGGYNPNLNPPPQVWEEDEYETPIVTTNQIINEPIGDGKSATLQANALASAAEADPYGLLDAFTDLSEIHGQTTLGTEGPAGQYDIKTKYGKSWDFNPNNPDNLIGTDTHTLGSFIATDSSGNAILDSEGKPIFTTFGKAIHDEMQSQGMIGPNQLVKDPSALEDYIKGFSFEDIQGIEKDFWKDYADPWDSWADSWYGGHYQGEGYDDSMSDLARHYWFSESLDDVTARKEERRKEGLGAAGMRASEMEQMYDREFAAKANPLFDPGYSQSVTAEMNPIAAGMELFDIART